MLSLNISVSLKCLHVKKMAVSFLKKPLYNRYIDKYLYIFFNFS